MKAIEDIVAERIRQVEVEGWTPQHDDRHAAGELALAAAAYAYASQFSEDLRKAGGRPNWWPWDAGWWKPTNSRRDLVKAAALIVAEIERIDRAAASSPRPGSCAFCGAGPREASECEDVRCQIVPDPQPSPVQKSLAKIAAENKGEPIRDWHYDSQGYCDNPGRGY